MGGDGGSIPGRDVLAKTKKKAQTAAQVTFGGSNMLNWSHCSLTKQILSPPICCDTLGNLYNKIELIHRLIDKTLPPQLSYIKKMKKDMIDCNVTFVDSKKGIFECPITHLNANGKYSFVCLRKCGCVISQRALKNIKKGKNCLICNKALSKHTNTYTQIPLNPSQETKDVLFKAMMDRQTLKQMKKNSQNSKEEKEDKSHKKEETKKD